MTFARAVVVLAAATFAGQIFARPFVEDLYWQRWLGDVILNTHHLPRALGRETFTVPGAPYVPQEWLFSLLHAAAMRYGGDWLVLLLPAIAATIALLLIERRCEREGASAGAQLLVIAGTAILMIPYMAVRVQIVAWPLLAALTFVLGARTRLRWLAIPITAVWANLHASAAIAPAICVLDAASCAAAGRFREALERAALALLTFAALFATPLGAALPAYAAMLARSPIRRYISEWRSIAPGDLVMWIVIVLLAAGVACSIGTWKERYVDAGRAVAFVIVAFSAVRYVPLFAIVTAPLAAQGYTRALGWYRSRVPRGVRVPERIGGWAPGIVLVVSAFALIAVAQYAPKRPPDDPRPAMTSLALQPRMHALFCDDFAWCSVALDYPNMRVFLDGRADPYPMQIWRDWSSIRWTEHGWQSRLAGYGADTVVTRPDSKLDTALMHDGHWRAVAVNGPLRAYERENR